MKVPSNQYIERDQMLLAMKKRAGRLLAKNAEGKMYSRDKKNYIHLVRAIRTELAEREYESGWGSGLYDPFRSINDFREQELGEWEAPTASGASGGEIHQ